MGGARWELDGVFAAVDTATPFDPEEFRERLARFGAVVPAAGRRRGNDRATAAAGHQPFPMRPPP